MVSFWSATSRTFSSSSSPPCSSPSGSWVVMTLLQGRSGNSPASPHPLSPETWTWRSGRSFWTWRFWSRSWWLQVLEERTALLPGNARALRLVRNNSWSWPSLKKKKKQNKWFGSFGMTLLKVSRFFFQRNESKVQVEAIMSLIPLNEFVQKNQLTHKGLARL